MLTELVPSSNSLAPAMPIDVVHCAHCGLEVPAGLVRPDHAEQFCCRGCEGVFQVIRQCGLGRYYALREDAKSAPRPVNLSGRKYAEFDDAAFRRLFVRETPSGTHCVELYIEGVHCGACVWLLERLPRLAPGVIQSQLDLRRSLLHLEWDDSATLLSTIGSAIESLGYVPHAARDATMRESRRLEDRRQIIRLGIAGACAGNVMLLAAALYAGLLDGMDPTFTSLFRWTSMGLTIVSVLGPGAVFFRSALAAIRARTLHLDVPIAIGLGAGLIWGVANTLRGGGEVYFDSLSVLVFALLLGRWVQRRQQRVSADAMELLFSLTPSRARLVQPGRAATEVPVESLQRGQVVEVRAGESIPVDGEIVMGRSCIDQSLLTGETTPIKAREGSSVTAGAVNVSTAIHVRVQATGEATRLGKLTRLVEDCSRRRAPIVRLGDRLAGWFVIIMLALAALTAGVWLWIDPARALENAVALLIVTCPCALGLATPLAVTAAIGKAARHGILIKGGDVLERLSQRGSMLLDKTGTITEGRISVQRWIGSEQAKPLVAALEGQSSHPIAQALVRWLGPSSALATDVHQTPGEGIAGTVNARSVAVGSPAFILKHVGTIETRWHEAIDAMNAGHLSCILVAVDQHVQAVVGLGDAIRSDAHSAIDALRGMGWKLGIVSGDSASTVQAVAAALNLDSRNCRGAATPEQKLAIVRSASRNGPVVMVGDGVNDAAALAASNVGIAVHGGAEASLAAADVYLNRPGLMGVVEVVHGAARTVHVIRRNLLISITYNAVAAGLAMTGIIHPLIAAILMPMSSLTVVAMSYRSRTFGDET